jgi:hypothetical protein
MNDIDDETANPDPVGTITSLSSLDVPSELDADWNVDIREPTAMLPIPVRGHLRGIGLAACHLAQGTLRHRERPTARTRGADLLLAWTITRDNRQLTCSGEPKAPARATGARGRADDCALGVET